MLGYYAGLDDAELRTAAGLAFGGDDGEAPTVERLLTIYQRIKVHLRDPQHVMRRMPAGEFKRLCALSLEIFPGHALLSSAVATLLAERERLDEVSQRNRTNASKRKSTEPALVELWVKVLTRPDAAGQALEVSEHAPVAEVDSATKLATAQTAGSLMTTPTITSTVCVLVNASARSRSNSQNSSGRWRCASSSTTAPPRSSHAAPCW
jgi:hypothetical protein